MAERWVQWIKITLCFQFDGRLNTNRCLQALKDKDEEFWRSLLNKYLVEVRNGLKFYFFYFLNYIFFNFINF